MFGVYQAVRATLMLITDQPFGEWTGLPGPAMSSPPSIARHHATIIEMNVESYRGVPLTQAWSRTTALHATAKTVVVAGLRYEP